MLDWRNGNLRIVGGRLSSTKEVENGIVATLIEDGNPVNILFKKTDNPNSNFARFTKNADGVKKNDPICALVNESQGVLTVYSYVAWYGMIRHDKLVDENGDPLTLILGKITKNVPYNTVVTGTDGEKYLRSTISMYHGGYDKGFWKLHFDHNKAVMVNGIYQNTEAIALVKNITEVKNQASNEQVMEGVCLAIV
jgi:hypothetical protein